MLRHEEIRSWYGWAELSPQEPVVAGTLGRWQVTYHAGRYGVAAGGSLKLLFHSASDWPELQGRDPYEENFATVLTPGRARLAWRYEARGHAQPWSKAVIVDVAQWGLDEGETVVFYLGDPEGGSPGVRAPTVAGRDELRVVVDAFGQGRHVAVPSPTLEVVAGPAERLELIAPSQVAPGQPFALTLRLEDRWGNPAQGYVGRLELEGAAGARSAELGPADRGVCRVEGLRLSEPGIQRLRAREAALGLAGESNPIDVRAEQGLLPLWGDLHGQAADAGSCFRFARDVAGLDFCAQQAQAHTGQLTPSAWQSLQAAAQAHDERGRFAAFLGYHWAGNTGGGGSRHVLFAGKAPTPYHCAPLEGYDEAEICYPLAALHEALQSHEALLVVGMGTPAANLDRHDPELEPLLEVHSAWGQAPWLLKEALERGYRLGFIGSSGSPQGRPGASWPGGGDHVARGGLTCVYASDRSRDAIWQALRARRCYATSGPRILLDVQADGHLMGEVYHATRPPELRVRLAGTAEIECLEIHRGVETVYRYPESDPGLPGWVRVAWGGAMARDWPRHLPWDGTLRSHGARIVQAVAYGFDSPLRGIVLSGEDAVSWRSLTAGNENGLLVQLEATPDARLEFHAPLTTFSVPLAELPLRQDLGGEGLHVRIEPRPRGLGRRELELRWAEEQLQPGTVPYYVTVRQVDGARAWSSPIYVCGP